ncbi:hypothetical protein ACA910_001140 [Epithemia clementina (nom. ined.)]
METPRSDIDDDDMSVATVHTGNRPISNAGEAKEFVVKFLFRPHGGNNNTEVARTHYAILRAITDIYPEVKIFDNYGVAIKEFPPLKSYDAYLRHFKLQFVKANDNKHRKAIYLAFHRIVSPVPLGEIRRHATVSTLLHKVNTRLSLHHWTEDETRIANLGFFVGFDPTNILPEEMVERIRRDITMVTERPCKKIPRFRCGFSSPFSINPQGVRISTKGYDL